jgi:uncharacterized cysteine cluster protein YcgN (CxxCxxCC family)
MMAEKRSEIMCAMCGKVIIGKDQTENQEKIIFEIIDDTRYTFDSNDCVLMFKKFRNVYGTTFIWFL